MKYQIVKYSLYNCTTIIGENVRYFMNKYDISRDDWNSPINILYNKMDLYSTQHTLLDDICVVVVVYPLPWPLLVGGVRCSRLWSTSQLLRPSGQQCSHSGGVCPQIQGRQCGAYVGAVEEMMCVVCVDVTEGA